MKPAEPTLGKRPDEVSRYLNPRSDPVRTNKPPRTSDIILGMTSVTLAVVWIVWLLAHFLGPG